MHGGSGSPAVRAAAEDVTGNPLSLHASALQVLVSIEVADAKMGDHMREFRAVLRKSE